jgi:transposase
MNAHSMDLRERVAAAVDRKEGSQRQIAKRFAVPLSFVVRLLQHRKKTGSLEPIQHHAHRPCALDYADRARLRTLVQEHPDATLEEYVAMGPFHCNPSTLWRTLRRMGMTRKRKTLHAAERDRPDVKAKRAHYRSKARMTDAKRLVFLDETGLNTSMTTRYGWAPRGERVEDDVPTSWSTTTLVAAINLDGVAGSQSLPGAMTSEKFGTFIRDVLAPALHEGDLVVADNLSAHNSVEARKALHQVKAKLWHLPPYSSDYNPIEEMWSKVKQCVRRAGARTREDLYRAITEALHGVTRQDIAGWFRHSGLYAFS